MAAVFGKCFGGLDCFLKIGFPFGLIWVHGFDIPLVGSVDLTALL